MEHQNTRLSHFHPSTNTTTKKLNALKRKRETHPIQPRRTRGWWETGELVWMYFWVELDVGQLRSRRTNPTFLALVRRDLDQVHHTQKTNECHEGYLLQIQLFESMSG